MTLARFVRRSLRHRLLATVLSALSVALGVALVIGIDTLRREARAHFDEASVSWDLVVGPKGSPLQVVLAAVFLLDEMPGTVPESLYGDLARDPRVARALPWTLGDRYGGFRIVGTSSEVFGFEVRRGVPIRCAAGRPFAQAAAEGEPAWEAVAGATAAREAGLGPGSTFEARHGVDPRVEGKVHREEPWTVVGVLEPTGTPLDRAILVPYGAFLSMEGHDPTAGRGEEGERRISAVVVKVSNPVFTPMLFHQLRARDDAQPALPAMEISRLFDLVGNGDRILLAVSLLVVVVAAVGILVSLTNSMSERRRDIAMMRALGAPRRVVAGLVAGEAAAVGLLGAAAGFALGHGGILLAAARLTEWTGVRIRGAVVHPEEALVLGGAVLLCALAGLVPAAVAYRTEVAAGLA